MEEIKGEKISMLKAEPEIRGKNKRKYNIISRILFTRVV